MKAYVIKNKEGKYYDYWAYCFCDNLDNTCILFEKEDAIHEIVINEDCKDCEVVEITIAEVDLQHQLAEKDKEIEKLKDFHNWENEMFVRGVCRLLEEKETETRHQVCEEIKKKLEDIEKSIDNDVMFYDPRYKLELKRKAVHKNVYKILDQIEKGESGKE